MTKTASHLPKARSLFAGAGAHGARFAAELLTELAAKQRTVEAELSMEETINAIRRAAKQGEGFGLLMGLEVVGLDGYFFGSPEDVLES